MEKLLTKSKKSLDCYRILRAGVTDALLIYTNKLTPEEAFSFFGDSDDISELVIDTYHDVTGEKQMSRIMRGYTNLFSVQKPIDILDEKMLLIMLLKPTKKEEN